MESQNTRIYVLRFAAYFGHIAFYHEMLNIYSLLFLLLLIIIRQIFPDVLETATFKLWAIILLKTNRLLNCVFMFLFVGGGVQIF